MNFFVCLSLNPSFIFTPRLKHRCLESVQMSLMPDIMISCNSSFFFLTHNCFPPKIPLYFTYHKQTFSFFPPHSLAQSIRRYLFSSETESLMSLRFLLSKKDKTKSSVLCPLGLKWPEDRLMKWNKLLWLSSLAAAVEESQGENSGEGPHTYTHTLLHRPETIHTHRSTPPWYCPGLYLSLTITEQADNG